MYFQQKNASNFVEIHKNSNLFSKLNKLICSVQTVPNILKLSNFSFEELHRSIVITFILLNKKL